MAFLTKKISQILSLVFLALFIFSCDDGCVEADQFDVESLVIESNPINDGIFGTYDAVDGGQRANWHETGLKSNGDRFLMQISGSWTALGGNATNSTGLKSLPRCNFCAKKHNNSGMNCICYNGQSPTPELGIDGTRLNVDCSVISNQNDPTKCTCTQQFGAATAYDVYHFPLNILEKNETIKIADKQTNCKYDRGMGAYVALWGSRGVTMPMRAYHLFSEEEVCNVVRDSNGRCLDSGGNDITHYVFKSANSRIFMKDDKSGNNGTDLNTGDDVYHTHNEDFKVIMWDRYYSDNYGKYNIQILRGVGNKLDPGLLEFLVNLVEEVLLGKINNSGEREGGIIEFMYKSIIQDSGFVMFVHISLILYITLFGIAHLFGVVEMNRKELLNRVLKIGLIVLFTSRDSWYFYNKIVVAFFKDSMDYVVAMMMSLIDSNIDPNSLTVIAQMDRSSDLSQATRFSYVDVMIKNLLSVAVAKKIFGLFITNLFGFLYIPIIYGLIFFFILVMLYVASIYLVNVIKIVFVLSLGPVFMIFTLFSKTSQMFKNWLAFLGARSLEIIVLFTILYLFLNIIDKNFTDLFLFRACGEIVGGGSRLMGKSLASFVVLVSYIDRSFIDWMMRFINIAGFIFITKLIIEKSASLSGSLISIGGVANKESGGASHGASSANLAGNMMGSLVALGKETASKALGVAITAGSYSVRGLTSTSRKSGLAGNFGKLTDKIPFRGLRTLARDRVIDGAIKRAASMAGGRSGADRDDFIRGMAMKELQAQMYTNPNKSKLLGVDMQTIGRRFDQKLIQEPLQKFLKEEAKRLKSQDPDKIPFGKDMREALKASASQWAAKNISEGAQEAVGKYLSSSKMKDLMKSKGELSSNEAAKRFAGNKDLQNRYMQHLKNREAKNAQKKAQADKRWYTRLPNNLGRFGKTLLRNNAKNPQIAQKNFMRKIEREENRRPWHSNPLSRIDIFNTNRDKINRMSEAAQRKAISSILVSEKGLPRGGKSAAERRKAARKTQRRDILQDQLREMAARDIGNKDTASLIAALGDSRSKESLFERAARIDAANKRDGVEQNSAQLVLSKMMREKFDQLAQDVKDGKIKAKDALEEREKYRAGIYSTASLNNEMLEAFKKDLNDPSIVAADPDKKLNDRLNDDAVKNSNTAKELDKAILEQAKEQKKDVDRAATEVEKSIASGDATQVEQAKKELGLVAHKFEVEFGKSITDVLLKQPDIGLKASNVFLGVAPQEEGKVDAAVINAMKISGTQVAMKAKISKMDLKIKQFELNQLEQKMGSQQGLDDADRRRMAELSSEIQGLETEVQKYETEATRIETDIKKAES